MTPLTQKPIKFINKANCIVDLDLLERACLWYSKQPLCSKKIIALQGNYPCVAIYHQKVHIHRLLMGYVANRKLLSSEYVHHKNRNKLDCRIENLQILSIQEHQSLHNKGKVIPQWQIERLKEWHRKQNHKVKEQK